MARRNDIDAILQKWEYTPGQVCARIVTAGDGREVLQMRIELGVLQLETTGRPDGWQPFGSETYYDYLLSLALQRGEFTLEDEHCFEIDREFLQYYHRRICWLEMKEFEKAAADAEHTLALMDFVRSRSPDEEWTEAHEQYRPFVLFHHAQARGMAALSRGENEQAVEMLSSGITALQEVFDEQDEEMVFEEDDFVQRLIELRESIRNNFEIGETLHEQLEDAVRREEYERAATLRDEIARRDQADAR